MMFADVNFVAILIVFFLVAIIALRQAIWNVYIRTEHLRVAIKASNDFYDRAVVLLKDPATPDVIKTMIFDLGLAVSDERDGRKAMMLLFSSLADIKHNGYVTRPRKQFLEPLDQLRRSRGDLYDAFHEALGAAFAAIVSAHGSSMKRSKMALSYDASGGDRSKMLSLAESLDTAIAGWRDRSDGGPKAPAGWRPLRAAQ